MRKLGCATRQIVSVVIKERTRKKTSRLMLEPRGKMKLESMVLVNPDQVLAEACLDQVCERVCTAVCLCVRLCVLDNVFGLKVTSFIP